MSVFIANRVRRLLSLDIFPRSSCGAPASVCVPFYLHSFAGGGQIDGGEGEICMPVQVLRVDGNATFAPSQSSTHVVDFEINLTTFSAPQIKYVETFFTAVVSPFVAARRRGESGLEETGGDSRQACANANVRYCCKALAGHMNVLIRRFNAWTFSSERRDSEVALQSCTCAQRAFLKARAAASLGGKVNIPARTAQLTQIVSSFNFLNRSISAAQLCQQIAGKETFSREAAILLFLFRHSLHIPLADFFPIFSLHFCVVSAHLAGFLCRRELSL